MKTVVENKLTALETLALSKAVPTTTAKDARGRVGDGREQAVDIVVRIFGTLNVAEDHITHAVQKAKPFRLLAAALGRLNGVTVEALVREAERVGDDDEKALKEQVTKALEAIKGRTATVAKGRVTTNLTVRPILPETLEAAEAIEAGEVVVIE